MLIPLFPPAKKCELNVSGSRVFGTYETDNDSNVILTLPYTEGWSLYVDGKSAIIKPLATLLSDLIFPRVHTPLK